MLIPVLCLPCHSCLCGLSSVSVPSCMPGVLTLEKIKSVQFYLHMLCAWCQTCYVYVSVSSLLLSCASCFALPPSHLCNSCQPCLPAASSWYCSPLVFGVCVFPCSSLRHTLILACVFCSKLCF